MAKYIRQPISAETITIKMGPFISATDLTVLATATIQDTTFYTSKNGAALTVKHDTTDPAVDRDGYYLVTLDATDCSALGRFRIESVQTGYLPVWEDFTILSQANYDAEVAAAGVSKYDLIDAPNATAITAINAALTALIVPAIRTISADETIVVVKTAGGATLATFTKTTPGGVETWTKS